MRLALSCLLILGAAAFVLASAEPEPEPAAQYALIPESSYQRSQLQADPRSFFTVTLTLSTSTTTTTSTLTTTCTTSTAALKACITSGRRRRGVLIGGKQGRGLFYNENETEEQDGLVFLPSAEKPIEQVAPVVEQERVERQSPAIPYVIQPGFNPPSGTPNARFLLNFSTTTTTLTSTSTFVSTLTAICSSTSQFQLCGSGK